VYRSVFLLIVYVTIILLKQVLHGKNISCFWILMHLNFNSKQCLFFFMGQKAILPLYDSDSLKWSHNKLRKNDLFVDSLVRLAQMSFVMASVPASC